MFNLPYFLFLAIPFCHGFFVEVRWPAKNNDSGSTQDEVRLLCAALAANNIYPKRGSKILWKGSNFGPEDQEALADQVDPEVFELPAISINSSQKCYLLTEKNTYKRWLTKRDQMLDARGDSFRAEPGLGCPPGYRIQSDRCFPCLPGSFSSGQVAQCSLCPKNFYSAKKAADSCLPCPEGQKTTKEGASSKDNCVYLDEKGFPINRAGPPWVLIFSLIAAFIALAWIALAYFMYHFLKKSRGPWKKYRGYEPPSQAEPDETEDRLLTEASGERDDPEKGSLPDDSSDEHLYAEIGDFDLYEEPIRTEQGPVYGRFVADPTEKPRQRRLPSLPKATNLSDVLRRISSRSDLYEVPREEDNDGYEVPRVPDNLDHEYEYIDDRNLPKTTSTGFDPDNSARSKSRSNSPRYTTINAAVVEAGHRDSSETHGLGSKLRKLKFSKSTSKSGMEQIIEEDTNVLVDPSGIKNEF